MSAAPVADSGGARPHRTQSTSARHATQPSQGGRSHAQSYRPSGDPQALANVARRDGEQSNLAQSSSQPRSASRDGGSSSHHPVRSDSVRTGTQSGSRSDRARYTSADATSQPPGTNGMPPDHASGRLPGTTSSSRKRAYITCSTGSWQLGKTIGAGSMGKVKLARNQETGEQVGPYATMLCPNLPLTSVAGCCQNRPTPVYRRTSHACRTRASGSFQGGSNRARSSYRQPGQSPVYLWNERCIPYKLPLVYAL
jgi:hypothetical protein